MVPGVALGATFAQAVTGRHSPEGQLAGPSAALPGSGAHAGSLAGLAALTPNVGGSVPSLGGIVAASTANVPGVPLPASPVYFTLDSAGAFNIVYSVYLRAGDSFAAGLIPPVYGTTLRIYAPGITDYQVSTPVAMSTVLSDGMVFIEHTAPTSGTYYLVAINTVGSGEEAMLWSIWAPSVLTLQGPSEISVAPGAMAGPTGRLTDYYSGNPLAGQDIEVYTSWDGVDWAYTDTVTTDANGYATYETAITAKRYFGMYYDGSSSVNANWCYMNEDLVVTPTSAPPDLRPVHRFWNYKKGVHFYTANEYEKNDVIARLWWTFRYEGVSYFVNVANPVNGDPLYRFYNFRQGVHFYTANEDEKNEVIDTLSGTYRFEGVAYNVSHNPSGMPVYRFWNYRKGVHFYTANESEKTDVMTRLAWTFRYEGVAYYVAP